MPCLVYKSTILLFSETLYCSCTVVRPLELNNLSACATAIKFLPFFMCLHFFMRLVIAMHFDNEHVATLCVWMYVGMYVVKLCLTVILLSLKLVTKCVLRKTKCSALVIFTNMHVEVF